MTLGSRRPIERRGKVANGFTLPRSSTVRHLAEERVPRVGTFFKFLEQTKSMRGATLPCRAPGVQPVLARELETRAQLLRLANSTTA